MARVVDSTFAVTMHVDKRIRKQSAGSDLWDKPSNVFNTLQSTSMLIDKPIKLSFDNVSYTVRDGILSRERRKLLDGISGEFRPGELTAIMGPSGAGKSTLMDILAGFTTGSTTGTIMVDGCERDLASFRRSSAYIMQNDNLQDNLTVQELMWVAADLKLTLKRDEKLKRIDEILSAMSLSIARRTRTEELSGGQKKRLAIALELINNPPVMFFDEPISGLDCVSSKQCMSLLKELAHEGRTIICSIHQPSATLFNMIDHLYIIAEGHCIYTGGTKNLVSYLTSLGLNCPINHNPADFVLEVCNGDYGSYINTMKQSIESGRNDTWRSAPNKVSRKIQNISDGKSEFSSTKPNGSGRKYEHSAQYTTSFRKQLFILLKRNAIRLSRDKALTFTRLFMHLIVPILVGIIFFKIGQDAAYVIDNFNLLFFNIMFVMFSSFSAAITTFPTELPILTREHFNRWYKLRSFYLANKIADLPVQFVATSMYAMIVYNMSGQIFEVRRLLLFTMMCIIVSLVAQEIGLILGISMKVQNGMIFGPLVICPFLIFSGFFVHLNDAHPCLHWLFHMSFLKYAFEGIMIAIYGYDRPKLHCSDVYCHFTLPETFLKTVDMSNVDYWFSMAVLIGLYVFLDITAYVILKIRLKKRI